MFIQTKFNATYWTDWRWRCIFVAYYSVSRFQNFNPISRRIQMKITSHRTCTNKNREKIFIILQLKMNAKQATHEHAHNYSNNEHHSKEKRHEYVKNITWKWNDENTKTSETKILINVCNGFFIFSLPSKPLRWMPSSTVIHAFTLVSVWFNWFVNKHVWERILIFYSHIP